MKVSTIQVWTRTHTRPLSTTTFNWYCHRRTTADELNIKLQCWFKLSGQNEQNLNFQTRFSQIWLRLDKKEREQKLLRISPELIWCHFFSEILNKNFTPKMGQFGFFQLIKNYAETTLLIDTKIISQEASYAVQQSLTRVKSPKICANCLKFIF